MTPDDAIADLTPLVKYLARRYARPLRLEPDDVFQETAILIIRNAHRYSLDDRPHARRLTNLLVRSAAVGLARKRSRGHHVYRYPRPVSDEMLDRRPAPGTDCEEPASSLCEGDVRRALARLPAREREAVTLRFLDGLGYDEIERRVGFTYLTVKADERKGLERLRGTLATVG